MSLSRIVEYVFFFSLLIISGYMVWLIITPFLSALALSAVIVTICSPLYYWLIPRMPRSSKSLAALLSTIIAFVVGILPIIIVTGMIVGEVATFYQRLEQDQTSIGGSLVMIEEQISSILPGFELDLTNQVQVLAEWLTGNLANIFAGTISLFFLFFISLIGSFYFFRDGHELLQVLIKASPLPDHEDKEILERMGRAVRGVFTGTILVAIIQATLATLGMLVVGVESAILLGSLVAIAAMIPGVGTGVVMVPVSVVLIISGNIAGGVGLLIWSLAAVGVVDNLLGPYLMSRGGNNMHPFIILMSVLGGLALFGPIGFLVGPVVVTLFLVLLEIYNQYIVQDQRIADMEQAHD